MAIVPQVGVLLGGAGSLVMDPSCTGTGCSDSGLGSNETVKYDDRSRLALELDVLDHLGPKLRLGGGLMIVPSNSFEADTSTRKTKNGAEFTPLVIVEGVFGDKIAGALRGFVGLPILVPAADLDDVVESLEATCDEVKAAGASCSTGSGPFLGYTLGAGVGVMGQIGEGVALRGDLALQYQSIWGPSMEASGGGTKAEVTTTLSTTRVWLMAGLEL
ncbi:MAG: hypothetical protein JW940_08205 [Polyangiaceae bacterium]|nr:hypothetical protein [Polyangiaceae bacterium]